MKEHNKDLNINIDLPPAGPMPQSIQTRLSEKRKSRRLLATSTITIAACFVVAAFWIPSLNPSKLPSPSPKLGLLKPVELRFDDPIFQDLDQPFKVTATQTQWTIGSRLNNNWPTDF
jgi:hypothetical protein